MISFIFSLISIFYSKFLKFSKKFIKKKRSFEFNRKNLYKWMNLTKKERYNQSRIDADSYRNKRKDLLKKIREEYKTLKK